MIEKIVFEPIRTDLPGMFYQYDIPWLRTLNAIVTYIILISLVLGMSWLFNEYLKHKNDPVIFEEFPNMGRWNLPCL